MNANLSIFDILLTPIYILFALIYAYYIKNKYINDRPEYNYFALGLMAKIVGACGLGLVYFFYYGGGDTINYHQTAVAYAKLIFTNQEDFFTGWLGNASENYLSFAFDETSGYPVYKPIDKHAFFVIRLLMPIVTLGFYSYFASAVLTALITYGGVWKLYQTFLEEFPQLKKELAIACLFIPSCVFWGSGLMKDSFTLSAVGWFTFAFYNFFIKKRRNIKFVIYLIIAGYVLIAIKPYILFALLPGSILWLSNNQIKKIGSKALRNITAPILLVFAGAGGYLVLTQMGDSLGVYKVDTVLERAVVVQQDMKADYYGGNSFDIGDFDNSATGVVSKAPVAIFAGIFRPGIWDVKNVVMLISSLENTYLLILTLFLLIKLNFVGFFKYINQNPLILFSILFSLFFAFSVGLTVANFGSLVRLRIPELPFFTASIFIIRYYYEQESGKKMKF